MAKKREAMGVPAISHTQAQILARLGDGGEVDAAGIAGYLRNGRSISDSAIYMRLSTLQDSGLVTIAVRSGRRFYRITEKGKAALFVALRFYDRLAGLAKGA